MYALLIHEDLGVVLTFFFRARYRFQYDGRLQRSLEAGKSCIPSSPCGADSN
jgi:hypothetical protein